jgi:DNA (cytosine-5)-methyltransferase 1
MKVLELFAGLGACSKALERLGVEHEIVDAVEIDKYAIASFNAIHGTNFETQDITTWDKDIEVDLIMHGSPCQDFSVAGKQAGGDVGSGTRSSLMYETIRIVGKLRPKYVIWENVKNLLSEKHRHNFDAYLETMKALGYTNYYQVLNAKDYGIPQNRERVFTISVLGEHKPFEFPEKQELKIRLKDILDDVVEEKFYLTDKNLEHYQREFGSKGKKLDLEQPSPTLTAAMGSGGGNTPYFEERCIRIGGIFDTEKSKHLRKLTPKECWRLMGFNDGDFEKASKVCSNSQLYKQAGNSIVVNVLVEIFRKLLN